MQLICSAAVAAIVAVSSPTPCAASGALGGTPAVASAENIQLSSNVGFGLPRLPKVPKVPKVAPVPQPKWP